MRKQDRNQHNNKPKGKQQPYYLWFCEEGSTKFLEKYGEYFDSSERHNKLITEIWMSIPPSKKEAYYKKCGKSLPATISNSQGTPVANRPQPSTSSNFSKKATKDLNRVCNRQSYSESNINTSLKSINFPNIQNVQDLPTPTTVQNLIVNKRRLLYDILKYRRCLSAPKKLCLSTEFHYVSIIPTCSILSDRGLYYTYPCELAIISFNFEQGVLSKKSLIVSFSPQSFMNANFNMKQQMRDKMKEASYKYKLNPENGMDVKEAWNKYHEIVHKHSIVVYDEQDEELVKSCLRALSYPIAVAQETFDNNLFSIQALADTILKINEEEPDNTVIRNYMSAEIFANLLETELYFDVDSYCDSHAELARDPTAPNMLCPLAYAASRLHILFEYMNQFDMLGIQAFYNPGTYVLCSGNVGSTVGSHTTSEFNETDRIGDQDSRYPPEVDDVSNALDSLNIAASNESGKFEALLGLFKKTEYYWVVLPEICFNTIPDQF